MARPAIARTAAAAVAVAGAFFPASGCSHVSDAARRDASFQPFAATHIGAQPLPAFLLERSGTLIAGLKLRSEARTPEGRLVHLDFESSREVGFGTVTAIDGRGYFLTAAHCLKREPAYVVLGGARGGPGHVAKARIVWRGDPLKNEPDLAVLHIAAPLGACFEWALDMKRGDIALAVGLKSARPFDHELGFAAGSITGVEHEQKDHPPRARVLHKVPLHHGDSGGPLTDRQGKLIGINTGSLTLRVWPFAVSLGVSQAERPDLAWLRTIIDEDFARQPAAAVATPRPLGSAPL